MLDTDACDKQVGCILWQKKPKRPENHVGYWSRSLNKTEQAYDTTPTEGIAGVRAVLLLIEYLKELQFTIQSDNYVLRWISNITDATEKLVRWCLRVLEFDFRVVQPPASNIWHQRIIPLADNWNGRISDREPYPGINKQRGTARR